MTTETSTTTTLAPQAYLARAAAWLAKQVDVALAGAEITPPQYRVLCFLDEGSAESAALARRLAVRPPTVTAVIDGLVARGLVERHHAEDDRRRVRHLLTTDGRTALSRTDEAVAARLQVLADALGDEAAASAAFAGLAVWRQAMAAHRERVARP